MRLVSTPYLQSGQQLARTIYSENGTVLLGVGVELTDRMIQRLATYGIPGVYIEDKVSEGIIPEEAISEKTRSFAINTIYSTMTKLMDEPKSRQAILPLSIGKQYRDMIKLIMDELQAKPNSMINLTHIFSKDSYLYHHSVNVAITCITMGMSIGLNQPQLIDLGLGAILHDIGKVSVPSSILNKPGPLNAEEWEVMMEHPRTGFDILRKNDEISLLGAHIALQHHEKEDGSGYPRKMTGEDIHLYGKIAAIADVYEALTASRPYKPPLPPHEAIEYIMGNGGHHFNYEMVKVFCRRMSPYPIGSTVHLSTGETGIVTEVNPEHPLRPILRIIKNENQEPLTVPFDLDLRKRLTVLVTGVS
ncbi:HD-GYP domain-containing protein [Gorillibacterium massiliense]|uniref:HD-GYP domain-containing protein n=1 Tax=Gorillibacterium massiliense TaxID=1280390 RepID=UPI000592859E|nr:HD-GYP domain-containing protein [Gorillibacterium massiliense]